MKVTKLGHCCLLIEENNLRILTDPGMFSETQNSLKNIDIILITHEHADHLHMDSVNSILKNNLKVKIITNKGVGKILQKNKISFDLLEHGQSTTFQNIKLEGHGEKHAIIYQDAGQVINTGYFIGERLFYPGDAFYNPQKPVEILALPVAGPWMKISEAIDYAKEISPRVCFPVHDGMFKDAKLFHHWPEMFLSQSGVKFVSMVENSQEEF